MMGFASTFAELSFGGRGRSTHPTSWRNLSEAGSGSCTPHLDNPPLRNYPLHMNIIRRTLDIDADTDARLREMADERGQEVAAVLAEAVALLDSVVDIAGPDIGEDRLRLDAFKQTRAAVPLDDVKTWVASWGSANELPRPAPRRIG